MATWVARFLWVPDTTYRRVQERQSTIRMVHYLFALGLVSLTLRTGSVGFESYYYRLINNILESVQESYDMDFTVFCTSCGLPDVSREGTLLSTINGSQAQGLSSTLANPLMNLIIQSDCTTINLWLQYLNLFMERRKMLTADASSDRLGRLFNIFVFLFPQNLVHDCITAARTSGNTPNLAIDTSIFFVVHSTDVSFVQVWELYHIKQKRILREIFTSPVVLSWKEVQNFIMEPLTARRHDLFQVGISMSCVPDYEVECSVETIDGDDYLVGGLAVSYYRDLRDALNFSEVFQRFYDFIDLYDYFNSDNETQERFRITNATTWGILSEELDIAMAQNIFKPTFPKYASILQPTYLLRLWAFFSQPQTSPNLLFALPFTWSAWMAYAVLWTLIVLLAIFFKITPHLFSRKRKMEKMGLMCWEISDCSYCILASMCAKNLPINPKTLFGRALILTAMGSSLLLNTAYQAGLMAMIPIYLKPLRTFEDILKANYLLTTEQRSLSLPYILTPMFRVLNIKQGYVNSTDEDAFIRMPHESLAHIEYMDSFMDSLTTYFANDTSEPEGYYCNHISFVPLGSTRIPSGCTIPKHSPFRELFNSRIVMIIERGLSDKYKRVYRESFIPACHQSPAYLNYNRIRLKDTELAFFIVFYGFLIAISVLVCETCTKKLSEGSECN